MLDRLSTMSDEMAARDIQITNLVKKNKELNHECAQMQNRLMEEKLKLMEGWN